MCGIAGAIQCSRDQKPLERVTIERMLEAIQGRGPDAQGIWLDPSGRVALANARLSTQDRRPIANQPLMDADGAVVITFNGEIYNHAELRNDLQARGYRFRTRSDTEVVLNAYRAFGREMLSKFEGQFAFVLYDLKARRVLMARDPLGICPLYYSLHEDVAWFASEPRALLQVPDLPRRLNRSAVYHWLILHSTPPGSTLFEGIQALRAGSCVEFDMFGPWKESRYAERLFAREAAAGWTDAQWAEQFRALLKDAVHRRLAGDKEVGILLSGGLDSGGVLALMRLARPDQDIKSLTVGFQGPGQARPSGELAEARQLSALFRTSHEELILSPEDLISRVERFELPASSILEPIFDAMASRMAARGVQVVLTGEGADETFFGYDHYLAAIGRLAPAYGHLAARYPVRAAFSTEHRIKGLLDMFVGGGADLALEEQRQAIFADATTGARPVNAIAQGYLDELDAIHPDAELDKQLLYLEISQKLPECFLRRIERPMMGQGVEVRVPYLDLRLIKMHFQLPMRLRVGGGTFKEMLKRALDGLVPQDVLQRPKSPFGLPATRSTYYQGSSRTFEKPMLHTLFLSHYDRVRQAVLDGALMREGVLNADYLEARLAVQQDADPARFDPFFWQVWNLAVWYERWIAPASLAC